MPEVGKKKWKKGKNDAKEQRQKRGRQHAEPVERKIIAKKKEKEPTPPKGKECVGEKPEYEPTGPGFYKNFVSETDETLKITGEENLKYKKKEIQNNWAKYELPFKTYEEIDEQVHLGANYEALIKSSHLVGGHFQFKHEKLWDLTTGPTPYDKYFDINMENLNLAVCTIPFHERNHIDQTVFNESEIKAMNDRATKFQQKYYNDKKFTTPELEAQKKIINSLKSDDNDKMDNYTTDKLNKSRASYDTNTEKLELFEDIKKEEIPNAVANNERKELFEDIKKEEIPNATANNERKELFEDIKKEEIPNAVANNERKETKSCNKIKEVPKYEEQELFQFRNQVQKVFDSISKSQDITNILEGKEKVRVKNTLNTFSVDHLKGFGLMEFIDDENVSEDEDEDEDEELDLEVSEQMKQLLVNPEGNLKDMDKLYNDYVKHSFM